MLKVLNQSVLITLFTFLLGFSSHANSPERSLANGSFTSSSLYFSLDACSAYNAQTTNFDYSEFTAVADNSESCLQMTVMNGNLYRDEPLRNPHSCTEGVNGSNAMCVSSVMECAYPAGNMRSVIIDVIVEPGTEGSGTLSSLSFYEQAPQNYSWIDGASGINNYPTLYGVRVLKDGTEVWRSSGNSTSLDWTLESFSFVDEPAFTVSERSIFRFEFVGYCLIGNGAEVTAWDLDEIRIESACGTIIDGGSLSLVDGSTETSVCIETGQSPMVDVVLSGNEGPDNAYIITDENGEILALPTAPPFSFENAGTGVCLIWNASYSGAITGLEVGNNASEIEGCFDLSNAVRVVRTGVEAGTISTGNNGNLCASNLSPIEVDLSGNEGESRWVVTDLDGEIIALPSGPPFDVSQIDLDQCLIWHLSFAGNISGLSIGGQASNITGDCFEFSDPITITKQEVDGGVIQSGNVTFINLCDGNGANNVFEFSVANTVGENTTVILVDENGNIIAVDPVSPFDFSTQSPGRYEFYNVSWNGSISGLTIGGTLNGINGDCFELSNSLTIDKEAAEGGTISTANGDNIDVCIVGSSSDPIDVSLTGESGSFSRWLITDADGNIIGLPAGSPVTISSSLGQECFLWHLSFEDSFTGLIQGQNVSDFTGCFDLSNAITINKTTADAEVITDTDGVTTFINLCNTSTLEVDVTTRGTILGDESILVITDRDGNIIDLTNTTPVDFGQYPDGTYRINRIASSGGITGLTVGGNLSDVNGPCFDVSNTMTVNKFSVNPGVISSSQGDEINVCSDGFNDMADVSVTGSMSTFSRWLITDTNGNIISFPGNPPLNFESLPEGTCLLWHISYENSISGLSIGSNASDLNGCFELSNAITVNKSEATPVTISSGGSTSLSICLEDNVPDLIEVTSTNSNAVNKQWVITDAQGNILELPTSPPFDLSGAGPGTCLIYCVTYSEIEGLASGENVADLDGCFGLSNSISVDRDSSDGGQISSNGMTELSVCVGDGNSDLIDVTLTGSNPTGINQWVITDANGTILDLPTAPPFDFDGAGTGVCFIWNLNYIGAISGAVLGGNASDLMGCYGLSNPIAVNRFDFDSGSTTSILTYPMDNCDATNSTMHETNFTELTPVTQNNPGCTQLSGTNVYRNNPTINTHSCTPGINGTPAVCVSSLDDCNYEANSDLALRFDVTVSPAPNGMGSISTLSFYEAAPQNFQWINGMSGPNNFPTRYGIRVLKDGTEVFRQQGLATTNDYTQEIFDFSANPDFTVSTTTLFQFELLGYCLNGSNSAVSAWDIDNIQVTSNCLGGLNGGQLSIADSSGGGTTIEVCTDDGIDENIEVNLFEAAGPNMAWVITDENGMILDLPTAPPFNFEGAPDGTCLIWNLAFVGGLQGAEVGNNASDLQGCYSLSNPITVIRRSGAGCTQPIIGGGILSMVNGETSSEFCIDDNTPDVIHLNLSDENAPSSAIVIVDDQGMIIDVVHEMTIDLGTIEDISSLAIYHLAYFGLIENMSSGNALSTLIGDFELSNPISITLSTCEVEQIIETPEGEDFSSSFYTFPNPAIDVIEIKTNEINRVGASFNVYDSYGRIIDTYQLKDKSTLRVNLEHLVEGYYFIQMNSGENQVVKTFVKS